MPNPRFAPLLLAWLLCPAVQAAAQRPDSAVRLPEIGVTVTRTPQPLRGLGASVTLVDSVTLRRHRIAPTLDEALAFVPGVVTSNRWNYSVDQRLSIRGFGARANFGLRGVKILLDGVPQTLPDGQSQLTNLDLGLIDHAEVLRGAASALHGNAAGGVISFTTRPVPDAPWQASARVEGGSFNSHREQLVMAARSGPVGGTASVSRFATNSSRQHARAEQRQLTVGSDWSITPATTLTVRFASADDPRAENPGALTLTELGLNRDSAAASNILRGADKRVTQSQLAFGVRHEGNRFHLDATLYGLTRHLENPLATPPPTPVTPDAGTWVGIDRVDGGFRFAGSYALPHLSITGGADVQSLRDDRTNRRASGGVPSNVTLLDQREEVTEFGPFVQLAWALTRKATVRGGVRQDASRFTVIDHFLTDGDASGARTMSASSGNIGLSVELGPKAIAWADVATLFETPTTTELGNRPAGDGGFNTDLGPQRSVSQELGLRGESGRLRVEAAVFRTTTRDAIIPYREVGGRTYYRNAGHTRTTGAEAGATLRLGRRIALLGSWTLTHAIFTDYRVIDGSTTTILDGHRLAGIPEQVARLGIRGEIGHGLSIDIDQGFTASMWADDGNAIPVDGWGSGVTGARIGWQGDAGATRIMPFFAVSNLFDRKYVGSVSINGAAGRVFEPAAGRAVYLGATLTAQALPRR